MSNHLYIVDGTGYIYRAYYAIRPLSSRDGTPTHALIGFARMMIKLLREKSPDFLIIAFDSAQPTFRQQRYPAYKSHRQKPPEDLLTQIPLIFTFTELMQIYSLRQPGFEADDIIATLSHWGATQRMQVTVVSADKDLLQLVDNNTTVYDPMKELHFDAAAVEQKYGILPSQLRDVLALAGDSSDNIPGVPKVGLKTAASLVQQFGGLHQLIAALQIMSPKQLSAAQRNVLGHIDDALLSYDLVGLQNEIPNLTVDLEKARTPKQPNTELGHFLHGLQAYSIAKELGLSERSELNTTTSTSHPSATTYGFVDRKESYVCVQNTADLAAYLQAIATQKKVSIDLETTSKQALQANIVGIALAVPQQLPACYIPLAHSAAFGTQLPLSSVLQQLKPLLEDLQIAKVGQHLKYDANVLRRYGITLQPFSEDAMIAAYLLDAGANAYSLDALAERYLGYRTMPFAEVITHSHTDDFAGIPLAIATRYAAEDADVALVLCTHLAAKLQEHGLWTLYRDLEMPLSAVLAAMEFCGIGVDLPYLQQMQQEFTQRLLVAEQKARAYGGENLNLNSPKQLAQLFFHDLGLQSVRKTKTGASTDQAVLAVLAKQHPLPALILNFRHLGKLKSTYIDALLLAADAKARIHTQFNQTLTTTGRLSSSNPNLQNIPIRSDDGLRIRAAFVAQKGWQLIAADYSQIELRLLAHLSGDERLIAAFFAGEDIHAATAKWLFGASDLKVSEQRRIAKTINFGILYGLSDFGLSQRLGIPRELAKAYIENYFKRFAGVKPYLDTVIAQTRRDGFVATLAGRRRYLPHITSQNLNLRRAAEREAINMPIQGGAADLLKKAMVQLAKQLEQQTLRSRILLTVHDEIVLEAPKAEVKTVMALIRHCMEQIDSLKVPLVISVYAASNWAKAHA